MSHIDIFENSMTSGRNGWELSATLHVALGVRKPSYDEAGHYARVRCRNRVQPVRQTGVATKLPVIPASDRAVAARHAIGWCDAFPNWCCFGGNKY